MRRTAITAVVAAIALALTTPLALAQQRPPARPTDQGGTGAANPYTVAEIQAYTFMPAGEAMFIVTDAASETDCAAGGGTTTNICVPNGIGGFTSEGGGTGSGETNLGAGIGGGLAIFDSKSGVTLQFNTLDAADFDLASNLIAIDDTKWAKDSELHLEDHAARHSDGGADEITVENLASACTDAQVLGGDGLGGLECQADAGGSSNSFETINAPAGTDPVAESSTDTLNLASGNVELTITGDASTDTLTLALAIGSSANQLAAGDHAHTGATISGIDISDDTNLAVTAPVTLTGDTVGLDQSGILNVSEADTEAELEALLTDVTNVFTNNDGALTDDDVTLADVQTATSSDFHNIGGTDDDIPESGDFTNLTGGDGVTNTAGTLAVDLVDNADGTSVTTASESGLEFLAGELSLLRGCSDGQTIKWATATEDWGCAADTVGGGGTANVLDLGDDATDESTDLVEIATTGDTNSVFTEPTADKLLINLGQNWPSADTADALSLNPADCAANQFANTIAANGDLTCAAIADADVPNTITIDLATVATTANAGDSATAFFSSGTIEHERGGLEADVSAGDGFVEIKGGATTIIKSNLNATTNPTATDDSTPAGYAIGSRWINVTLDKEFICLDATDSAAVWMETTASPSSILTTKGDLLSRDGSTDVRLPVGQDGQIIKADSNTATGLNWVTPQENNDVNSTGLLTGGVLSVGAGASQYSISDGTGQIVDQAGDKTLVSWTGKSNITPANIATSLISFVGINISSNVVEQTSDFTALQTRTIIPLGVVVHVDNANVDAVNNEQHVSYNVMSQLYDLGEAIGFFNKDGNVFSANGANLNFNKSAGTIFKLGANYDGNVNNPHNKVLGALTAASFQYRFSDGSNGTTGTVIDPDNLDNGAGGLTALANNKWSVQRIYSFISNNVKLQRGVSEYATKADAINGISTEPYVTEPSIGANGLLRGWLIVQKGATDLSDGAMAEFIEAPKFGQGGGTAGGASPVLTVSGTPDYITVSGQDIIRGQIDLATDVTGLLQESNIAATIARDTELHTEDHAARHSDGGADEVTVENLASACTDAQVLGGDGLGGVECQTVSAAEIAEDSIGTSEIDDDANTPTIGFALIVEDTGTSFDYVDPAIQSELDAHEASDSAHPGIPPDTGPVPDCAVGTYQEGDGTCDAPGGDVSGKLDNLQLAADSVGLAELNPCPTGTNQGTKYDNGVASCVTRNDGDVKGPAVHTDNAIPRWDGANTKMLQSSSCTIDDTGLLTCPELSVACDETTGKCVLDMSLNTTEPANAAAGVLGFYAKNDGGDPVGIYTKDSAGSEKGICQDDGSADGVNCPADADTTCNGVACTLNDDTIVLLNGNGAAPTTDGELKFDRTTERLQVGDGAATNEFYAGAHTTDEVGTLTTGDLCVNDGTSVNCTVNTEAELETALDALDVVTVTAGDITTANLMTILSDEGASTTVLHGNGSWAAPVLTFQLSDVGTAQCSTVDFSSLFSLSDTAGECEVGLGATVMTTSTAVAASQIPTVIAPDDTTRCFGTDSDTCLKYDETTDNRAEMTGADIAFENDVRAISELTIPNGTAPTNATTLGNISLDTDAIGSGATVLDVPTVGDGTRAIPIRACARHSNSWELRGAAEIYAFTGGQQNTTATVYADQMPVAATISHFSCNTWQEGGATDTAVFTLQTAANSGTDCDAATNQTAATCTWSDDLTCTITGSDDAPHDQFYCADTTGTVSVSVPAKGFVRVKILMTGWPSTFASCNWIECLDSF